MVEQHEWAADMLRCIYCGTLREHHTRVWQPCPRQNEIAVQRPSGSRLRAADDADVIHARIVELEAERLAIMSAPEEVEA